MRPGFEPLTKYTQSTNIWMNYTRDPLSDCGVPFEGVIFPSPGNCMGPKGTDTILLRGWYLPSEERSSILVILVHGGGMDRREMLKHVPLYRNLGWNMLLFDCSDHGVSESRGVGLTYGAQESDDLIAAVRYFASSNASALYARHNQPQVEHIVLFGTSVGGASVLIAAGKLLSEASPPPIHAVVSENPFGDVRFFLREKVEETIGVIAGTRAPRPWERYEVPRWIGQIAPIIFPPALRDLQMKYFGWRAHFDRTGTAHARNWVQHITAPLLLVHSEADDMVDIKYSYDLLDVLWSHRGPEGPEAVRPLSASTETYPPETIEDQRLEVMRAWSPPVEFERVKGARHAMILNHLGDAYRLRLGTFLRRALARYYPA